MLQNCVFCFGAEVRSWSCNCAHSIVFCNSISADRTVMAASRLLGGAAACVKLLFFAAGHQKSYWSGCIKVAMMICQPIFSILALMISFQIPFECIINTFVFIYLHITIYIYIHRWRLNPTISTPMIFAGIFLAHPLQTRRSSSIASAQREETRVRFRPSAVPRRIGQSKGCMSATHRKGIKSSSDINLDTQLKNKGPNGGNDYVIFVNIMVMITITVIRVLLDSSKHNSQNSEQRKMMVYFYYYCY